jgi:hypothetical protein
MYFYSPLILLSSKNKQRRRRIEISAYFCESYVSDLNISDFNIASRPTYIEEKTYINNIVQICSVVIAGEERRKKKVKRFQFFNFLNFKLFLIIKSAYHLRYKIHFTSIDTCCQLRLFVSFTRVSLT